LLVILFVFPVLILPTCPDFSAFFSCSKNHPIKLTWWAL
jgi:hypothetical protein